MLPPAHKLPSQSCLPVPFLFWTLFLISCYKKSFWYQAAVWNKRWDDGIVMEMLCIIVFPLIELKGFSALTKSTASTSSCWYEHGWLLMLMHLVLRKAVVLPRLAEHLSLLLALLFALLFSAILQPQLLDEVLDFYLVELVSLPWTPLNYFQRHYFLHIFLWCKGF